MATESTPYTSTPPGSTTGAESRHGTTDRLAGAAHETVDRLAERGSHAEERLRQSGRRTMDQSREYYGELNRYVREHPYTALGIAAAAGFLIGSLLRR